MNSDGGGPFYEVSQLVVRERQSRVRRMPEALAACFHPDATVTTSWLQGGNAAQFVSNAGARDASASPVVNRAGPPVVSLNGRRGVVELPSTTIRWIPVKGTEAVLTSFMRILHRVEERDGVWKISALTAINEGDTLQPAVGGADLEIDGSLAERFRHSYRFLAYTHALNGEQLSDDLYGTDRPEPVAELYAQAFAWLG